MKPNALAGALACALALSACAGQTPQLTQGKTVAGLWASLEAASTAADAAARTGVLKGANAAKVAADLQKATKIVSDVDAAYHANPATDVSSAVIEATGLLSDALCIVKPTAACPVH